MLLVHSNSSLQEIMILVTLVSINRQTAPTPSFDLNPLKNKVQESKYSLKFLFTLYTLCTMEPKNGTMV